MQFKICGCRITSLLQGSIDIFKNCLLFFADFRALLCPRIIINYFCLFPFFRETVDFIELLQDPEADLSSVNPLPQSEAFIDFLRKRALDESVYVRKNALQVLENILRFYASQSQDLEHLALELVGILGEHCRDPSVMVRKQIASSLTEIVKAYPDNDTVVHHWVEGKHLFKKYIL